MALDPITGAESLIESALNKFIPDPVASAQAKASVLQIMQNAFVSVTQAKASVITTEIASSSWLGRNWRPITMLVFVAIVANNYILAPYLQAWFHWQVVLALPPDMWSLLKIGIGGYIFCRTGEKALSHPAVQSVVQKVKDVAQSAFNTNGG